MHECLTIASSQLKTQWLKTGQFFLSSMTFNLAWDPQGTMKLTSSYILNICNWVACCIRGAFHGEILCLLLIGVKYSWKTFTGDMSAVWHVFGSWDNRYVWYLDSPC